MRKFLLAAVTALLLAVAPATTAGAAAPRLSSEAPLVVVSPNSAACCASAWYPFGYYSTKAKCTAAGKKFVKEIAIALAYKCTPYKGEYKLSILEAT